MQELNRIRSLNGSNDLKLFDSHLSKASSQKGISFPAYCVRC